MSIKQHIKKFFFLLLTFSFVTCPLGSAKAEEKEHTVIINIVPESKYEGIDDLSGVEFFLFKISDEKIVESGKSRDEILEILNGKGLEELKNSYIMPDPGITPPTDYKGTTSAKISDMGYYYIYSKERDDMELFKPLVHFKLEDGQINIPIINIKRTMDSFDLTIRKEWIKGKEKEVKIKLIPEGKSSLTKEVVLNDSNKWTYTVEDLPKYNNKSEKIIYSIVEDIPEGYNANYRVESSEDDSVETTISSRSGKIQYPQDSVLISNIKEREKKDKDKPDPGKKPGGKDPSKPGKKSKDIVKTGDRGIKLFITLFVLAILGKIYVTSRINKNEGRKK